MRSVCSLGGRLRVLEDIRCRMLVRRRMGLLTWRREKMSKGVGGNNIGWKGCVFAGQRTHAPVRVGGEGGGEGGEEREE